MFRNVRLKLTLTNTAVIAVVLFVIFSGIYLFMRQGIMAQSKQMMRMMASDNRIRLPRQRLPDSNYFYIRIDSVGNIIDLSSNLSIPEDELYLLVDKALQSDGEIVVFRLGDITYRCLKAYGGFRNDLLKIVFFNTQIENEILARLTFSLIITGFAAVLLAFFSSLFMADRALIPIKKSWERQRAFVADASHELRTPLSVVQTNLELVMGNPLETVESQNKWLANIEAENKIMSKLVDDLLYLARADSDEKPVIMSDFPLNELFMDTVNSFRPVADSKNIELHVCMEPEGSEIIYFCNDFRLRQLIKILLDNAIKYNHPGGKVSAALKIKDNSLEIIVADSGIGITKEHTHKIFERFYRVDTSRSRGNGGFGLGLSIAECIVKEHRGTIHVSSVPGQGSTFRVVLPVNSSH